MTLIEQTIEQTTKPTAKLRTASVGETPDLFANSPAPDKSPAPVLETRKASVDHLAAARKLQWRLRKARAYSPEEVKTGRLICRHLLALLHEADAEPVNHSPVRQQA